MVLSTDGRTGGNLESDLFLISGLRSCPFCLLDDRLTNFDAKGARAELVRWFVRSRPCTS